MGPDFESSPFFHPPHNTIPRIAAKQSKSVGGGGGGDRLLFFERGGFGKRVSRYEKQLTCPPNLCHNLSTCQETIGINKKGICMQTLPPFCFFCFSHYSSPFMWEMLYLVQQASPFLSLCTLHLFHRWTDADCERKRWPRGGGVAITLAVKSDGPGDWPRLNPLLCRNTPFSSVENISAQPNQENI